MARFYTNENFPLPVAIVLRELGHDVITSYDAGNANQAVPEEEVLAFAHEQRRVLLTINRKHFILLHNSKLEHSGIVVCSFDPAFKSLAERIDQAVKENEPLTGKLIRVNRPS